MFPFPTEKSSRGSVALFISNLYEVFTDPKIGICLPPFAYLIMSSFFSEYELF